MLLLDSITVRVETTVLLDGVTLGVSPGELVAVLGPNGAGKSTLLKVASGERRPDGGRVLLDGDPLPALAPDRLAARRAVMPQHSALAFGFTAREVAMLGRTPFARLAPPAEHDRVTDAALLEVGVAGLAARRYPTLSGGEAQRVHLARALAQLDAPEAARPNRPGYLLLDEPTSSLDLAHQHTVLRAARRRAEAGFGVLAVLHDLNLAAQYADRLAVLRAGRLVGDGSPAEVLTPALIHTAFEVPAMVVPHPCHACPLVVALPAEHAGDGAF